MTAVVDRGAVQAGGVSWYLLAAPPLILLCSFASFVRFHRYDPLKPEILIIAAMLAGFGLCLAALTRLRPATLEPLTLGVLTFLFLSAEFRGSGAPAIIAAVSPFSAESSLLASNSVMILGVFILTWTLRHHVGQVLTISFGVVLVSTLLLPASTIQGGVSVDRVEGPIDSDLPPIVHLILDEHIGIEGVPTDIEGGAEVVEMLKQTYDPSDFAVHGRAYSRFVHTHNAIPTLLNGKGLDKIDELVNVSADGYTLLESRWFEKLRNAGYSIRVYGSTWLNLCNASSVPVDYCYNDSFGAAEPIQRMNMTLMDKVDVIARVFFHPTSFFLGGDQPVISTISAFETLNRFIDEFFRQPKGTAYIVHVLIPHHTFVFDKDCHVRSAPGTWLNIGHNDRSSLTAEEREKRYKQYFEQVTCVNSVMAGFYQRMRNAGLFEDATVIVHGDHGSRISTNNVNATNPDDFTNRDMVDLFSTLFAIKAPQVETGYLSEPASIQSLFANMFLDIAMPHNQPVLLQPLNASRPTVAREIVEFGEYPMIGGISAN